MKRFRVSVCALLLVMAQAACNSQSTDPSGITRPDPIVPPDTSQSDPINPPITGGVPLPVPPEPAPEPGEPARSYSIDVLLFNGTGVSTSDWQSTEQIVKSQGLSYKLVNSAQLNAMSLQQISDFGVIVVPGGSGGTIAGALTVATRLNVRKAVRDYGVGYVGFCAGAWVAVGPEAEGDATASYGLAVAKGSVLPAWYPDGNTSLEAAVVELTFATGQRRDLVWWGGPATPEWSGGVIARYDNGKPAISETRSGKGYVVIAGTHPEAPSGWRATAGNDPDGMDFEIAIAMIQAAIHQQPLTAF